MLIIFYEVCLSVPNGLNDSHEMISQHLNTTSYDMNVLISMYFASIGQALFVQVSTRHANWFVYFAMKLYSDLVALLFFFLLRFLHLGLL